MTAPQLLEVEEWPILPRPYSQLQHHHHAHHHREPLPSQIARWPKLVPVSLRSEHNFYAGFAWEMGSCGLFVATHLAGELDEPVLVTFTFPGYPRIATAICVTHWVRDFNPRVETAPGIGFRFSSIDSEAMAAVAQFMHLREPIFWDS